MALAEDAASVLEEFVQNVANLPAEITHLMEEIHAKDRVVQECRTAVNVRDNSIQKFLKTNGAGQANPKEDVYSKAILSNFDKARAVQDEKVALSEKAALLLDRQIKRLDLKIRDLQNEGSISIDPQLPSLLTNSSLHTRLPPLSTTTSTGASTPLHPLSGNAVGPSTTIANTSTSANPLTRLGVQPRQPSPLTNTGLPTSTNAASSATAANRPANATRSPSIDTNKRRRLNPAHIHLSAAPIRQSSLGPGTPKPTGVSTSRGGSAGPRPASKNTSSLRKGSGPPHARIGSLNPAKKLQQSSSGGASSSSRRRHANKQKAGTANKTHASDTADENDSVMSGQDDDMDDGHNNGGTNLNDDGDAGMEDAEGDDERKYCTCRNVSYGNMVACDNEECPYEWFHWSCVGMTKEPVGTWFCEECRGRM